MGYIILQLMRFFETLIFATGIHMTVSVGGISFFGFSVAYLVGAYVFAIAAKAGLTLTVAVIAAILAAVVIGFFFSLLYRRLSDDSFAVFGVASIFAFDALVRSWGSVTGGVLGIAGVPRPDFVQSTTALLWLQIAIAVIVLAVEYLLLKAPFGRALVAHKESPSLLSSAGVSPKRIGMIAIVLAAGLAGLSGILGAWRIQYLDPSFADIQSFLFGLTICIIATKPKISWLIGASAVVVLLPEVFRFLPFPASIFAYLRVLTYGIAMIILVHRISAKYTTNKRTV